jgi:putative inorganic carbon (hco3(-)) transporter
MRPLQPLAQTAALRKGRTPFRAATPVTREAIAPSRDKSKWNLAFLGLLAWIVIQYTSLPQMFPVLQHFDVAKLAVAATFLGVLLSPESRRPAPGPVHWLDACVVLFFLVSLLSAATSAYASDAISQLIDTFQWCVIYFMISRIAGKRWQLYVVMFLIMLLNLKLAQFSIRSFRADQAAGASAQVLAARGEGAGSTAFFGNAGDFGVAMCVVWPLAGALFLGEARRWRKWFFAICFFAFLGAIVTCSSRGALVGAAVIAFAGVIRSSKRVMGLLMMLLVVLAFFVVAPKASRDRMQSALHPHSDPTSNDRLVLWHAGIAMFESHFLLGVGPGNFEPEYVSENPRLARLRKLMAIVPHSIYVEALSELGIAGFIPLLALWALVPVLNARTRKLLRSKGAEKEHRFEYNLSWGLDLALVGYLVSGAFITVLYYPHLWVLLGLTAALHSATALQVVRATSPELQRHKEPVIRRGVKRTKPSGVPAFGRNRGRPYVSPRYVRPGQTKDQ